MGSALARARAVLLVAASSACAPASGGLAGSEPPVLRLVSFQQEARKGVCLNETLVFLFSNDLDRASLTPDSFRIEDAAKRPARGSLHVRGASLVFVPEFPKRKDLSDGGLLPARTYTVQLLGFPAPNGLRGSKGEPLEQTLSLSFRTAASAEGDAPFLHTFPKAPGYLYCERPLLGPLDPIELACDEALDPRTVAPGSFALVDPTLVTDGEPRRLSLRARLAENGVEGARLELHAIASADHPDALLALDPGEYFLIAEPGDRRIETLGGRPVEAAWEIAGLPYLRVSVVAKELRRELFEFDSVERRSPRELPGFDGTAHWGGSGSVRVRLPAAVGNGSDGEVRDLPARLALRAEDPSAEALLPDEDGCLDIQATRLRIAPDETLDLSEFEGLVILRAQCGMELAGQLRRRGWDDPERTIGSRLAFLRRERESLDVRLVELLAGGADAAAQAALEAEFASLAGARALSAFLARARSDGIPWTVLVAGGDIRIPGSIEVDGPLLIVAGGWIRISGRVEALEAFTTPEGGGNYSVLTHVYDLDLVLDEPLENPLREPLRLAISSDPIRPLGGVESWLGLLPVERAGSGRIDVLAVGERDLGPRETESYGPVSALDLDLLQGCTALRLWIEIEVPPGPGPWNPPVLERLELSWARPAGNLERADGARGRGPLGR